MTFEEKLNAELDMAIRVWLGRKRQDLHESGRLDADADLHLLAEALNYPSPAALSSVLELDMIPTQTCLTLIRQLGINLEVSVTVL